MNLLPWILCAVFGVALVATFVMLRGASQKRLAELQARHAQYQKDVNAKFDTMKRQVGQLQNDLVASRQALQEAKEAMAALMPPRVDPVAARQALQRELAAGDGTRATRSKDGFADTQVTMPETNDSSLLLG